jgi:hypothetical protein
MNTIGASGLTPLMADLPVCSSEAIVTAIRGWHKYVVTFLGFGELGYEDSVALEAAIRDELRRHCPDQVIVNTGTLITEGFNRGIADVYEYARDSGFTTTGIHPSVALCYPKRHYLSPFVDHVFFVYDETWGGWLENVGQRSPTLETLMAVTDEVVVIGGGKHTAEEMQAFLDSNRPVRFYAAEMNHRVAREWFAGQGEPDVDYRGAAWRLWLRQQAKP